MVTNTSTVANDKAEAERLFIKARGNQVRSDRQAARRVAQQLREFAKRLKNHDPEYARNLHCEACILGRFT